MKRIDAMFKIYRARSDIFSRYAPGDVPYVGNGLADNAVVGLVKPRPKDRVFKFAGIAVSAFCEATVQAPPFIACGRAGNGLVVLEPIESMDMAGLASYAAYLNLAVQWRFSWYWQTTMDRLRRLHVPAILPRVVFDVVGAMPQTSTPEPTGLTMLMERVALGDIFELQGGDYHSLSDLSPGDIPVVSCGDLDNGVCGMFDVQEHVYSHRMTIAFNGATLTAKYHPYRFAAKDDVAVCTPKRPLRLTTELFIQVMLRREQWRFSYYRKCYKEKLERVTVPLPVRNGEIDENAIQAMMRSTKYWRYLEDRLSAQKQEPKARKGESNPSRS